MTKAAAVFAACSMLIGATTSAALADSYDEGHTVDKTKVHRVYSPVKRRVWVVNRHVGAPGPIVSRPAGMHTNHDQRVPVLVVNTPIYIDPNADYKRQGEYPIDDNHHLLVAQRLYRSLNAKPARTIRKSGVSVTDTSRTRQAIRPHMILMKPQPMRNSNTPSLKPNLKRIQIPHVPRPPSKKPRLLLVQTDAEPLG